MTHYNISYADMSLERADKEALSDIIDYIGEEKFITVTKSAKIHPISFENFQTACSIGGIRGYPVRAWYRYVYGTTSLPEKDKT